MLTDDNLPDLPILEVGAVVWDDLARCPALIYDVRSDEFGNMGVWLTSRCAPWDMDGGRFPWEVSVYDQETD